MAQVRKPEIEERIVAAARAVFAERGYGAASIADIAARAEVATGNVYRYFEGKEALFAAAVPEETARELRRLVKARVEALSGVRDVDGLAPEAPYRVISEAVLRFSVERRHQVIVLLARAEGTAYEGYAARMTEELVRLAVAYGANLDPPRPLGAMTRFVLTQIYRGLLDTMVAVLEQFERERDIRRAVDEFSAYHLTGLARIFATEPAPDEEQP